MILVVFARSYGAYMNWAREKFPHSSPEELQRECLCITDARDIERVRGLRRGQLFVDIGGATQELRDFCWSRAIHEVTFEERR